MIFAAGLGTRLGPLTDDKPKALVTIKGKPLLEIVIERLIHYGFDQIIVNVHHFADLVEAFLLSKAHFGINITISDERKLLLDTGGGLQHASWFFDDHKPFLVHNVDIISTLDLGQLYEYHLASNALASLASRDRSSSRYLLYDQQLQLCGWKNVRTGETRMSRPVDNLQPYAFSGIHVIDPKIFPLIRQSGVFSIIEVYLALAKNHLIQAYPHTEDEWLDVGKPENLSKAEILLG